MDEKDDDVTVALREAMNKEFAWFLRQVTDHELIDGLHDFLKVRWTFRVAFLQGVIWKGRQKGRTGVTVADGKTGGHPAKAGPESASGVCDCSSVDF